MKFSIYTINTTSLFYSKKYLVMPAKFAVVDEPVLISWGIRIFRVNNYLVFYRIDEAANTVHVVRFLYGKRNWKSVLRMDIGGI